MTNVSTPKRLLWVDDDEEDRFLYEVTTLEERGWTVTWAKDGNSAVQRLTSEAYDLLLLDQVFPFVNDGHRKGDVWGGCRLLAWLRCKEGVELPVDHKWSQLNETQPFAENSEIPVIMFSAFYDDEVAATIKRIDDRVAIEEKPSDDRLFDKVERRFKEPKS